MELLTLDLGSLAGQMLRKMFLNLEHVLEETSFDLLRNLLDMVYEMKMKGEDKLLHLFTQHLGALARQKLPQKHPIHRFIRQMSIHDANQLDTIRACHCGALDELQNQMAYQNYHQELHDACIVCMQRMRCPTSDPYTLGIWTLKSRSTVLSEYYTSCWFKIVSLIQRRPTGRPQVIELASQLIQKRGWSDIAHDALEDKIVIDAKRRLAVIELGTGGVLCDESMAEDVLPEPPGPVEGSNRALLHEWHEMVSIEHHFRLVGLDQDAELIKTRLEVGISADLARQDHVD